MKMEFSEVQSSGGTRALNPEVTLLVFTTCVNGGKIPAVTVTVPTDLRLRFDTDINIMKETLMIFQYMNFVEMWLQTGNTAERC